MLPFGPVNGPQDFQQLVHKKFGCLDNVAIFTDDLVIASGQP